MMKLDIALALSLGLESNGFSVDTFTYANYSISQFQIRFL